MRMFPRSPLRLLAALAALTLAGGARAEVSEVRIARQLGLGYLQLYVMQERKLVEKHGAAAGLPALSARYIPLGGPAAINDALLTGGADYGAAGVPPFIVLWDRTRGNLNVQGVAALNAQPAFLNSRREGFKSLRDIAENDRIAVPSVKVSLQAILLQMAAEQIHGRGQHGKFDANTVSLSHPDGTAALLTGRTEITAHFTSPPFQYQQLRDPKIHRVLSSYEITGGPASFSALWTTAKFRADNPKAYRAVLAAVEEATAFIANNRTEAARIFVKVENSKLPIEFVESMLADKDIVYSTTPLGVEKFADFMHRTGGIKTRPASWRDLFFADVHAQPGS